MEFLENEEDEYIKYLNQREDCLNRVADLKKSSSSGDNLYSLKIRKDIKDNFVKWLDILNTTNVSREIVFDSDFKPVFGYEFANVIKGSTKTRIVLAMRAAVFEAYLKESKREFRFFILDTPKQQEIQTSDLTNYLIELNNLARDNNAQIIYSSTEFKLDMGSRDKEWIPKFSGFEKPMYLGNM
ncbi:hypothetical protein ASV53_24330 [Photobacterium sanguinicancri]|uniref:Uncharacterized protein n=1 Tax=Photobacterium sanguinicancri TaxID=875932 RepID=A0ABX4FQU9_9GAMM|nr:hypothetical protein ASV53_24330 [Photobacterium sanguinicancri]